jgi:pSer/pThr/pTyr-binding forkhead associated (FHA) protein
MKAKFVVVGPRSTENAVLFSELPVIVGRGPEAGIRLGDAWVSRCHCEIAELDGALVVRDLGSRHGTLVNRQPVSESLLLPGDELLVGLTSLRAACEG